MAVKDAGSLAAQLDAAVKTALANGEVRPSHVIISAPWLEADDVVKLARKYHEMQWYVISHSNVGFLQADPHAIKIMRDLTSYQMQMPNLYVGGNCKTFVEWATAAWRVPVMWAPNMYNMAEVMEQHPRTWTPGAPLRIGLFGANRPLKNHITAAAAVVELATRYGSPVELLMSSGRNEGSSQQAIDEITARIPNLKVTKTGWLDWPSFRALIRSTNLMLQTSFTESFNVVTADAIAEGVPVVVGSAIDWAPTHWQADPDDPMDVAAVADRLLRDPHAMANGRRALQHYVSQAWIGWQQLFGLA